MEFKKKHSALFFAREGDNYSLEIFRLLKLNFKKVRAVWSKTYNEKINFNNFKTYDYIFCFRSYFILNSSTLKKAKIAAINFHPSTPEYRGVGGVNYAIFNQAKFFGVTAHLMDRKIDHGKIFDVVKFKINKSYSIHDLLEKTHFEQYKQAKRIIESISKKKNFLEKKIRSNEFFWSKKISNLKKLNNFYKIKKNDTKKIIQKKINSTVYKSYLPYVIINDKKFVLDTSSKKIKNINKKFNFSKKYFISKKKYIHDNDFKLSKIKIKKLSKIYVNEVIDMLEKSISSFKPNISHKSLWEKFKKNKNTLAVVALYRDMVVGYGSITFENKIRGGVAGHIEEIVTIKQFRKFGIGNKIMSALLDLATKAKCYKLVLQSNVKSEIFYKKLGFKRANISMAKRLLN
tara:strand:+ start:149 stop:1354 length:1206 start_codon:yes stop_codon:yes gene_type:complete